VLADTKARLNAEKDQALALKDASLRNMEITRSALDVKNTTYEAALKGQTPNLEPLIHSINDALAKITSRIGSMSELQDKKASLKNLNDQFFIKNTEKNQKAKDLDNLRNEKKDPSR
jgi:hypothetical protein